MESISALLIETSLPAHLITAWRRGKFVLLPASLQLEELMRVKIPLDRLPPLVARSGNVVTRYYRASNAGQRKDVAQPYIYSPLIFYQVLQEHNQSSD